MRTPHVPPNIFAPAVKQFWETRQSQRRTQEDSGTRDQGSRGAVTGGKQMDGFIHIISQELIRQGAPESDIYFQQRKTRFLPGYFRPSKDWDLLVVSDGNLLAALEVKSQVGSFGNNFNNRAEEAIGTAADLWVAYRQGAFGPRVAPWLGYMLVLEETEGSTLPVRVSEPHFPVFEDFRNASYARRCELLCRRLVLERQYSAACLLLTSKDQMGATPNYSEPAEDLSGTDFLTQLLRHVTSFYK